MRTATTLANLVLARPCHEMSAMRCRPEALTCVDAYAFLQAELFPAEQVASGSAFAAACNWLANFVCGLLFLPLSSALGGLCFLPFAAILVPFAVFVCQHVPETRGKSVQQILAELSFKSPKVARRF